VWYYGLSSTAITPPPLLLDADVSIAQAMACQTLDSAQGYKYDPQLTQQLPGTTYRTVASSRTKAV